MSQIATLSIFQKKDLAERESLADPAALETIDYNDSGFHFVILSVCSNEKLSIDWDNLEFSRTADKISQNRGTAIFIFSQNDKQIILDKLVADNFDDDDLKNYYIEFSGEEPDSLEPLKEAIKVLRYALAKIDNEKLLLLEVG